MPLSPAELEPLLRLALVQGIGPNRLAALIGRFGDADRVLGASARELRAASGIGPELASRIRAASEPEAGERSRRAMVRLARIGAFALTPDDPAYPAAFRTVVDVPFLLFGVGDLTHLQNPAVAVVGTRSPTPYGRAAAGQLSFELARAGVAVVSGFARGIDTAAHQGALDAGGITIAILGNGIEQLYPPENRTLFGRIRSEGVLLSEFPPGEKPRAGNFPRRNRLIAALARAVLIVEMGHRSGAQHTVHYALELGKEVLAVPGPIGSQVSMGTNQLIKDGARLVASVEDILEELWGVGTEWAPTLARASPLPGAGAAASADRRAESPSPTRGPTRTRSPGVTPSPAPQFELLDPLAELLLSILSHTPTPVNELIVRTGAPTAAVLSTLLQLELRGRVGSHPGARYTRIVPDSCT